MGHATADAVLAGTHNAPADGDHAIVCSGEAEPGSGLADDDDDGGASGMACVACGKLRAPVHHVCSVQCSAALYAEATLLHVCVPGVAPPLAMAHRPAFASDSWYGNQAMCGGMRGQGVLACQFANPNPFFMRVPIAAVTTFRRAFLAWMEVMSGPCHRLAVGTNDAPAKRRSIRW